MSFLDDVGVRAGALIAGLVGGVLSLSMMPRLTFRRAVTAVIGGGASAAYGTPLAVDYLGLHNRSLENGLAFVLGVVGLNLLAGIFKLSERWRDRPSLDVAALRGRKEDDE